MSLTWNCTLAPHWTNLQSQVGLLCWKFQFQFWRCHKSPRKRTCRCIHNWKLREKDVATFSQRRGQRVCGGEICLESTCRWPQGSRQMIRHRVRDSLTALKHIYHTHTHTNTQQPKDYMSTSWVGDLKAIYPIYELPTHKRFPFVFVSKTRAHTEKRSSKQKQGNWKGQGERVSSYHKCSGPSFAFFCDSYMLCIC